MKNLSLHHGIKRSPYEAMFGIKAKIGLKSTLLPNDIISNLRTEEDLETALSSISTTSNSQNNCNNGTENNDGT